MQRLWLRMTLVAAVVSLALASGVRAGGGQSYPNGAESFLSAMLPPPGLYLMDYVYFYGADTMRDDHGDDVAVFDDVTVWANVLRLVWMSEKTFLGATYGQHVFLPLLWTDLSFHAPLGPKGTADYDDSGVPYIIYSPMVLGWHLKNNTFHVAASLVDIYIPTGQDDGNLASVGHEFWTFEPVLAMTYLAGDWAFSAKLMLDFNTTQDKAPTVYGVEVDRDPGAEFHVDYSVSYAVRPFLRLGLSGYYYQQISDDSYDIDDSVPQAVAELLRQEEGCHSRVFAVGPGIWYNHKNMFFELRTQFETGARNKTEGHNVWFKFTYAF